MLGLRRDSIRKGVAPIRKFGPERFCDLRCSVEFVNAQAFFRAERKEIFRHGRDNKGYGLAWFLPDWRGALVGFCMPQDGRETREDLLSGARDGTGLRAQPRRQAADDGKRPGGQKQRAGSEYVGRGREAVDRGRAQWEEFVERGKNLVSDDRPALPLPWMRDAKHTIRPRTGRNEVVLSSRLFRPEFGPGDLFLTFVPDLSARWLSGTRAPAPDKTVPHHWGTRLQ